MANSVIEISREFDSDSSSSHECSSHMISATPASKFCPSDVRKLADMFPHLEADVIRNALLGGTFEDALDLLLAADSDLELKVGGSCVPVISMQEND